MVLVPRNHTADAVWKKGIQRVLIRLLCWVWGFQGVVLALVVLGGGGLLGFGSLTASLHLGLVLLGEDALGLLGLGLRCRGGGGLLGLLAGQVCVTASLHLGLLLLGQDTLGLGGVGHVDCSGLLGRGLSYQVYFTLGFLGC
jgi:hypothetical protein